MFRKHRSSGHFQKQSERILYFLIRVSQTTRPSDSIRVAEAVDSSDQDLISIINAKKQRYRGAAHHTSIMRIPRIVSIIAIAVLGTSAAFATGQQPEVLRYDGIERKLLTYPLESAYAGDRQSRPNFTVVPGGFSSGNRRGYVATWEISEGRLFFTDIESWACGENRQSCKKLLVADLFTVHPGNSKVVADWFTGELNVPDGKLIHYSDFNPTYERSLVFKVTRGEVSEPRIVTNSVPKREN